jgi:hypothetical protein
MRLDDDDHDDDPMDPPDAKRKPKRRQKKDRRMTLKDCSNYQRGRAGAHHICILKVRLDLIC